MIHFSLIFDGAIPIYRIARKVLQTLEEVKGGRRVRRGREGGGGGMGERRYGKKSTCV